MRIFLHLSSPPKDPRAIQTPIGGPLSGNYESVDFARTVGINYAKNFPDATCMVIENENQQEIERLVKKNGVWEIDHA